MLNARWWSIYNVRHLNRNLVFFDTDVVTIKNHLSQTPYIFTSSVCVLESYKYNMQSKQLSDSYTYVYVAIMRRRKKISDMTSRLDLDTELLIFKNKKGFLFMFNSNDSV